MFQFIEKGMRGGISYIANRYGKANNKYMKEYDEKAPSKYIITRVNLFPECQIVFGVQN